MAVSSKTFTEFSTVLWEWNNTFNRAEVYNGIAIVCGPSICKGETHFIAVDSELHFPKEGAKGQLQYF